MLLQRLRSTLTFRLEKNYRCINLYRIKLKCSEVCDRVSGGTFAYSALKERFGTSHSRNIGRPKNTMTHFVFCVYEADLKKSPNTH